MSVCFFGGLFRDTRITAHGWLLVLRTIVALFIAYHGVWQRQRTAQHTHQHILHGHPHRQRLLRIEAWLQNVVEFVLKVPQLSVLVALEVYRRFEGKNASSRTFKVCCAASR